MLPLSLGGEQLSGSVAARVIRSGSQQSFSYAKTAVRRTSEHVGDERAVESAVPDGFTVITAPTGWPSISLKRLASERRNPYSPAKAARISDRAPRSSAPMLEGWLMRYSRASEFRSSMPMPRNGSLAMASAGIRDRPAVNRPEAWGIRFFAVRCWDKGIHA